MELDTDLESFVSYLRTLSTFRAHQARVGSEAAEMLVRSFVSRYWVFLLFSVFCVPFSFPSPPSLLEAMEKERSANWKEIPLKITRFYRGILSKKPETVQ